MTPAPDPHALATEPRYYLQEINLESGELGFGNLDRKTLRESTFMDGRDMTRRQVVIRVPLAVMQNVIQTSRRGQAEPRVNFILHTSFCCSTLISRCLDIDGYCCALREPWVLMQLANYKRAAGGQPADSVRWNALLDTALALLTKPWIAGEVTLIKPSIAANNLAEDLIAHPRSGGILLLYSSLRRFLMSTIHKGEAGRSFVRQLFDAILADSVRTAALPPATLMQLTDLQIAAFVWYQQMDHYLRLLARFPQARIRTLDCDRFLAAPEASLMKLCDLFTVRVAPATLQDVLAGPAFHRYAKDTAHRYDAAEYAADNARIAKEYAEDIANILTWSAHIRPEGAIQLPLPRAL
ncbi:MAG: hypothetical protein ACRETQ_04350 [Gammaproteobacteria bacterium]